MAIKTKEKINGIDVGALKQLVEDVRKDHSKGIAKFRAVTSWKDGAKSESHIDTFRLGDKVVKKDFRLEHDEPLELLGTNTAANPQEMLMAAFNACIMATYVAVSASMGIELERLEIETEGELDLRGFLGIDPAVNPGYDRLQFTTRIKGNGTEKQFQKVHEAVIATSPNYSNMAKPIKLEGRLVVE